MFNQDGQIQKHDLREADDPPGEDLTFFMRSVEDVIRELLADKRFEHQQHFRFEYQKNADGERVFGESNVCISFQINAYRIDPERIGIAPVSLVIFIDGSWGRNIISARPIYGKCNMSVP